MIIHDSFQFHPPCSIGKDHNKFQPIRGFYGPWQPCWITDRNESNNSWLDHANEHSQSCAFLSHLLKWFSRRRLKCLRTDDGPTPSDGNSSHDPGTHFCYTLKLSAVRNGLCTVLFAPPEAVLNKCWRDALQTFKEQICVVAEWYVPISFFPCNFTI